MSILSGTVVVPVWPLMQMQYRTAKKIAKAAGIKPSELKVHALGLISGMFYTTKFDKIGLFLPKYLYGKQYRKAPFAAYVNPENPERFMRLHRHGW